MHEHEITRELFRVLAKLELWVQAHEGELSAFHRTIVGGALSSMKAAANFFHQYEVHARAEKAVRAKAAEYPHEINQISDVARAIAFDTTGEEE